MNRSKPTNYNKKAPSREATKFFLVYEGTAKEPNYFDFFNRDYFEPKKASILHVLEKDTNVIGSQPKKLIERAKAFIDNPPKDLPVNPSEDDKFRFILDVDKHPIGEFHELKTYCDSLLDADLFISNICFEVWLYFHLEEHYNLKSLTSSEMKTELGSKHTELKIKNYPKGYLTLERINFAIERAKKADLHKDSYFPAEKSSKVYLLMIELLQYSILNIKVRDTKIL